MFLASVFLVWAAIAGCAKSDVEFRYYLLASVPTPTSANVVPGILTPCDPCLELEIFTSPSSSERVEAAPKPVLVVRRSDVERVEILEWAMPRAPEERYYILFLEPKPSAQSGLNSLFEEYSLHAIAVTSEGSRASLAAVLMPASFLGGYFATRGEAERVAREFGAPSTFVDFDTIAHSRYSETWNEGL
jgi:hypothetical protein